jgi:thiosulfate/3-mercaptopyruvate sulfurtransferase
MTDIVSTDWVADHLDELDVVDVRDAWEYDGIGHLPGAVNIPFDSFRAEEHAVESDAGNGDGSDSTGMLPDAEEFEALLSEHGIATDDEIVAYDDMHGVFAARFLVTAELLGHDPDRLHLLDGDFSAWQRKHETTSEVPDVEPTDYVVDPPADSVLVDADAVAAAGDDPESVVVDTREDWEYEEGHVPGAVLLDWKDLVDDESRGILPREEALAVLEARGITPDRRIVLYCNTARRISHTYVVLGHLGFGDLAFYEGSLTEWENQGRPLETGS